MQQTRKFLIKRIPRHVKREDLLKAIEAKIKEGFALNYRTNSHTATVITHSLLPRLAIKKKDLLIKEVELEGEGKGRNVLDAVTPLHSLPYNKQIEQKREALILFLASLAPPKTEAPPPPPISLTVEESPVSMGYRNKCEFTFGYDRTVPTLGFRSSKYTDNPNSVSNPNKCIFNVSGRMLKIVKEVNRVLKETEDVVYDRVSKKGHLKIMMLREIGVKTVGIIQIEGEKEEGVLERLGIQNLLDISVDNLYIQFSTSSFEGFTTSDNVLRVKGSDDQFTLSFCSLTLRVSLMSFFQVNLSAATLLSKKITEKVGGAVLLDVCCGTGSLGLAAAGSAKAVIGIELDRGSVEDAVENARRNGVENARYVVGSVADTLPTVLAGVEEDVVVLLDPPRAGVSDKMIRAVRESERVKEILYVSCSYKSVKGNIESVLKGRFEMVDVWAVDMFPHTNQMEVLFHFRRKSEKTEKETGKEKEKGE